jgi:hypothetical protein
VEIGIEVNQNVKGPGARGPVQGLGASVKTVTEWELSVEVWVCVVGAQKGADGPLCKRD